MVAVSGSNAPSAPLGPSTHGQTGADTLRQGTVGHEGFIEFLLNLHLDFLLKKLPRKGLEPEEFDRFKRLAA